MVPDFERERAAMAAGALRVAGVDEAGRGPLAGPVYAAAVVLDPARIPEGLTDSKLLAAARREALAEALAEVAQVSIAWASVEEIDNLNILNATYLAMTRALAGLKAVPQMALIDGNGAPAGLPCRAEAVVKGDATCLSIAAASIVAKVARDREMCALAQHFAGYGWERNAGYGTEEHLHALRNLGVTPHHRRSFRPVYEILCQGKSVSD